MAFYTVGRGIVNLCGWQIRPTKSCGQGNDQLGLFSTADTKNKAVGLVKDPFLRR